MPGAAIYSFGLVVAGAAAVVVAASVVAAVVVAAREADKLLPSAPTWL